MENRGFEVKLNDKLLCKTGFENNEHVVTCIIDALFRKDDKKQKLQLNVSGLNAKTNQHNKWVISEELEENDIISIKVIKGDFDVPIIMDEKRSDEFLLEQKIKTYYKLKEELKEYLK